MNNPESRVLYHADIIDQANQRLGAAVTAAYQEADDVEEILLLSVLTGAMIFTADLMRYIEFPMQLDCVRVTRYHNKTQGANLVWHAKPHSNLKGKHVLLVDDIFDEGETMAELHHFCVAAGATDVRSVVLLDKQHDRRSVDYQPDFVGMKCEDEYVFGYGMDFEGRRRELADIHCFN